MQMVAVAGGVVLLVVLFFAYSSIFGAPQKSAEPERFIVSLSENTSTAVASLQQDGFIKHAWAFRLALHFRSIAPGGYKISKAMSAWEIAGILAGPPYMKWVVIPEGLRKEEIADILARKLGWSDEEKQNWITKYTEPNLDHTEGVYFPDTYLIPVDETPADVAKRFLAKFEEKFVPYAAEALRQNVRWPTLLKIASLIQREAAGPGDMPLIAGILWNRLLTNMKLDIDATLQYARGNAQDGWWPKIVAADKDINSPYNTYKNAGLPPHPIDNPGLEAISAVLHPEKTDCLYYLHDNSAQIHCAKTYAEHQANIQKYLR